MLEQNKLERLYFASLFRLVYYLRVRPEPTRAEHLAVPHFEVKALRFTLGWRKKLAVDKNCSLFYSSVGDEEKKVS